MSVINRVLRDLDSQGGQVATPGQVRAVAAAPVRRPALAWVVPPLLAALALAGWWVWPGPEQPVSPGPAEMPTGMPTSPAEPRLRLSDSLSQVPPAASDVPQPPRQEVPPASPAFTSSAPIPDELRPRVRLDTRLPVPRPALQKPTEPGKAQVVKEARAPTPQAQAEELWRQAAQRLEQGRVHDARERLEQALQLDPNLDGARQNLIALVMEAGDPARAEILLRDGATLHPAEAWYPRSLAQLRLQRGEYAQAAALLKASLARHPGDAQGWGLYAGTLARLNQMEDSAQAYREALGREPAQGTWWVGLGVALERTGNKGDAADAFRRALQTRLSAELRDFAQQRAKALEP